ncbi:MAG: exodeoxyribonuclease VII small subunit [Candidatus Cloacimonetes bacterium]|nr:exodeoxyribonuclease VII small subunit [Candidatus Cloacimonadota bacterium]
MAAEIKFEKAIKRLEEIVQQLETGIEELDTVIKLFEEGSRLVDFCKKKLSEVENRIDILTSNTTKDSKPREDCNEQ